MPAEARVFMVSRIDLLALSAGPVESVRPRVILIERGLRQRITASITAFHLFLKSRRLPASNPAEGPEHRSFAAYSTTAS